MLFDREYSFRGSHATKVDKLTAQFHNASSLRLFARNIDVYMVAPLVGFLYGRKADLDRSDSNTTKIFLDTLVKEQSTLTFNYKLIMVLDRKRATSLEDRLNKAFRYYGNGSEDTLSDEQLYEQYVLGGVDILYEKLIEDATMPDDFVTNLYDFLADFHDRYNGNITNDAISELCRLARQ